MQRTATFGILVLPLLAAAPAMAAGPFDAFVGLPQVAQASGPEQAAPGSAGAAASTDASAPQPRAVAKRVGARDTVRRDVEGAWICDWAGLDIAQGRVGIAWFFADDVEWAIYGQGSAIWQPGEDAAAGGFDFELRWHFVQADGWSLFAGVGIGMLEATAPVPSGGTQFNFTPSAGVGGTLALTDDTRLYVGVRWYHISNAGTSTNNPGMNGTSLWLGLSFGL